jgi:hypothetical protein
MTSSLALASQTLRLLPAPFCPARPAGAAGEADPVRP